jgi:hypothetical protein
VSNPSPWPTLATERAELLVVTRHLVAPGERARFVERARLALATLAEQAGYMSGCLAQSTDDADSFIIETRWPDVGTYRRALSAFDVKVNAVPLLSSAHDESSAFEIVVNRTTTGESVNSSGLAEDAGEVGLGHAAGPNIRSATP